MYKNTLCLFYSFFDEVENGIASLIFAVQDNLVILIQPKES